MLVDKKILVAGACGLLGKAIVRALIGSGAVVVAADLNTSKLAAEFIDITESCPSQIVFTEFDITDEVQVKDLFSLQQGLTGAVNSTYPRNKNYGAHFFDVSLESFNENLSLHLGSAFLFSQQCALYFKKNEIPFSLVNISSIYGVIAPKFEVYENTPMTMPVEYAAIKSAIIHLNKYVTSYVNDSRFRVNSVSPGGLLDNQPAEFLEAYKKNTFGQGMLSINDILGTILFFLSDKSLFVNGQNIIVDDGFTL